ncbi:MAG: AsmA family protein [Gammaproteobacteria bacterium]|nr:AsmA family protein [Gammaproteobacteria bacterium]
MLRNVLLALLALAVAAVLALGSASLLIDPNDYRETVSERLTAALGREVAIEGDVALGFGWPVELRVGGVRVANAAWGSARDMLGIEAVAVQVALWPLIRREVRIRRLTADGMVALLERDAQGRTNWTFETGRPTTTEPERGPRSQRRLPEVREVQVRRLEFRWRDELGGVDESFRLHHLELHPGEALGTHGVAFELDYRGAPLTGSGRVGSLQALVGDGEAWPIDLDVHWGGASLQARGHLLLPEFDAVDLQLAGEAADLGALGVRFELDLPRLPMTFAAHLQGGATQLRADGLQLTLGGSDLTGNLHVEPSENRAELRLRSRNLDLDAWRQPAASSAQASPLFSTSPWPQPLLPAFDAPFSLEVESLILGGFALSAVEFEGKLKADRTLVASLAAGLADGRLSGTAELSEGEEGLALLTETTLTDGSLGQLLQQARLARDVDVSVDAVLLARAVGRSPSGLARSLDGHLSLLGGQGRIHHRAVGALSSDLLGSLMPFLEQRDSAALNCLAGRFDFKGGVADDAMVLFDTETLTLAGKGRVDLGAERIAMVLTPRPKRAGLMNLAMPVEVTGPLANPEFRLESTGLARRSAGVALAVVNPLVLLVPVVTTTFGGADNPCLAAVEEARTGQRAKEPESRIEGFMRGLRRVIGGDG